MKKKVLGFSTVMVIGAYMATFLVGGNHSLSVKASELNKEVEQQLEIMYGDNWEDVLKQTYGENWSQQLEATYNTSINDCVMMEVGRLNGNENDFFERCLEYMYGSNWEAQLKEKYGADYQKSIPTEINQFLKLSAELGENENEQTKSPNRLMPRNRNQGGHCHD